MTEREKHYKSCVDYVGELRSSGHNPYPHKFNVTCDPKSFVTLIKSCENNTFTNECISMAGRVMQKRVAGRLVFYTVNFNGNYLQVLCKLDISGCEKDEFKKLHKNVKRGHIVGFEGYPGKSKTGEPSLYCKKVKVLSYCYHMLPSEHYGLKDVNCKLEKRYLDMMLNPETTKVFRTRSKIIQLVRSYLLDLDFEEVSTPVLWYQAGGANAKPFITKLNATEKDMHLRVAPELFLKQIVIGGMERVFEIGKQFRNEGVDSTHNPEFTTLEFYCAWLDYNDLMTMCEHMLNSIVKKVDNKSEINFEPPYKRLDIMTELEKEIGEKIDLSSDKLYEQLNTLLDRYELVCNPKTEAKMLDKLIAHFLESKCINPTFLINHPKIMSPLAKHHRDDSNLTERFELFINGTELANAYTELNDPLEQKLSFDNQQKDKDRGDEEAETTNDDFIEALEYGLPPTAGFGMGLDRLTMILTGKDLISEVIMYPLRG